MTAPIVPEVSAVEATDRAALGAILGLSGKVALVTGAGTGIGRAVALGLAEMGMTVAGVGRRQGKLDDLRTEAADRGLEIGTWTADVTDGAAVDEVAAAVGAAYGGLDAVVANAGISVVEPALGMAEADFRSVLDTNVTGVFNTARAAARVMAEGSGGSMVLTSSSFARSGFTDWAPYNASKAAVSMLTETLACEWVSRGVRVNAIAPTATLTDVNADLFADESFAAGVVAGIPAGRILQAAELVLPTAFLLSPINSMLIGHTLYVDGGQSL